METRILHLIGIILLAASAFAQNSVELADAYRSEPTDSGKVKILLDIGYSLELESPDSALAIYDQAVEFGKRSGYLIGAGRAQMYSGIVKSTIGEHAAALEFYDQALQTFAKAGYELGIAGTHVNIGVVHNYRGEFELAMESYMKGIRVYEKLGAKPQLVSSYGNVGGIFIELGQHQKGCEYFQKEMQVAYELGDSSMIADSHINLGLGHQQFQRYDSSGFHFNKCLEISVRNGFTYLQFLSHNNLADLVSKTEGAVAALPHGTEAVRLSKIIGNPYNTANAFKGLGVKFIEIEEYSKADLYLDSAIEYGKSISSKDLLSEAHLFLAESKAKQKEFEAAFKNQQLHKLYADSVFSEQQIKQLNELEVAYETEKKDRTLAENELELAQKTRQTFLMVAGVIALIVVIIFILLYFNQKQRLKDQEMEALEKEQEVAAIRSMMDGEEKERRRIARDLHDGLSAMLAAVKMKFSSVKTLEELNPAVDSLDEASKEVRRIAHNMMPEVLVNYGLEAALKDFVESVNQSKNLKADVQINNIGRLNDRTKELMIYRIVQELINNVIKHAQAKSIIVQLMRTDDILSITVEDDGVGFDVDVAMKKNGIGMTNLKTRVEYIGGELNIDSSEKNGTSVFIEVPLTE